MPDSNHPHLRVVTLPLTEKGQPAPNACQHLAVIDPSTGKPIRFVKMTRAALERADGGREVLARRAQRGRLRAWLAALRCGGRKLHLG